MQQASASRHALAFIFITVLIDAMGLGIIIPVFPRLITALAHEGLDAAARTGAYLSFAYAGMQFLFAPVMGNLSDRFGRRPVLIISLIGIGIDYLIMGLSPTLAWLFLGRTLSGMAGASYTTAAAYIADVSSPERRAQSFGLIGAGFGAGFVLGPALGGLMGEVDLRLPFFVSAGLAALNALYGLVVLKESLAKDHRRKFELWRANPLGAVLVLRRFPIVLPLCGVLVLMRLAHDANPAVWSYYTMLKFRWTPAQVGLSLMAIGAVVTVSYALLPRIVRYIGETQAVYLGLAGGAIAFAGYAFSTRSWMLYVSTLPFALVALAMPAIGAIMSREIGPGEQGALQGATTGINSLTSVFAPWLMGNLFAYFASGHAPIYFPGAAFAAAGLCLVLAAGVFALIGPGRSAAASPHGTG